MFIEDPRRPHCGEAMEVDKEWWGEGESERCKERGRANSLKMIGFEKKISELGFFIVSALVTKIFVAIA